MTVDDVCPRSLCLSIDRGAGTDFGGSNAESLSALDQKRTIAVRDWLEPYLRRSGWPPDRHRSRVEVDAAWWVGGIGVETPDGRTQRPSGVSTGPANGDLTPLLGGEKDGVALAVYDLSVAGTAIVVGMLEPYASLDLVVEDAVPPIGYRLMPEYWSGTWRPAPDADDGTVLAYTPPGVTAQVTQDADAGATSVTYSASGGDLVPGDFIRFTDGSGQPRRDDPSDPEAKNWSAYRIGSAVGSELQIAPPLVHEAVDGDRIQVQRASLSKSGGIGWQQLADWRPRQFPSSATSAPGYYVRLRHTAGTLLTDRVLRPEEGTDYRRPKLRGLTAIRRSRLSAPAAYYALALLYNEGDTISRGSWKEKATECFQRADVMLQRALPLIGDEFATEPGDAATRRREAFNPTVLLRG